jgi:FKBP-type peptidyl-prolyl cis-trans isomerase FklB
MKYTKVTAVLVALFLSVSSISIAQEITNKIDSVSYSVGVLFAKNIKQQGVKELNSQVVAKAIDDYMNGVTHVIPEGECEKMYMNYMKGVKAKRSQGAKIAGQDYLAKNKKKLGVMVTETGLQYEILTEGTGLKPTTKDKVKVHYHGTNIDGSVFDSSVDRGEPISFGVTGVIRGWTEALQMMKVGGKWRLTIPSELAYGARGAGAKIAPHAVLVFDVELLGIE